MLGAAVLGAPAGACSPEVDRADASGSRAGATASARGSGGPSAGDGPASGAAPAPTPTEASAGAGTGPAAAGGCGLPPGLPSRLDTLAAEEGADDPVRVILVVGDGVGAGYWTAARLRRPDLAAFRLPVVGFTDTRNARGRVTDSAASGTALATGCLTYNGAIGMGPDTTAVPSVTEVARRRGLATGIVTTSRVTHATPAVFTAHVVERDREERIAAQMADAGLDVLLGGGRRWFRPEARSDGRDLLGRLRDGTAYLARPAALDSVLPSAAAGAGRPPGGERAAGADAERGPESGGRGGSAGARGDAPADPPRRLVGLFAEEDLPPAPERRISLAAMTRAALDVLDRDPDGFFLVVEAAQPDWRGHGAEPLGAVQAEMLDLDGAIRAARAYRSRRPGTLLLVTADHETGGLAVVQDGGGMAQRWARGGAGSVRDHTANLVPHFAAGPGAEALRGIETPASLGRHLMSAVGGERLARELGR